MQLNIKQLILEGQSYEEITEAVHVNHSYLNKSRLKDPTISYVEGKGIEKNRKELADKIKESRSDRDITRKIAANGKESADKARASHQVANFFDNVARARSQTGGKGVDYAKELRDFSYSEKDKILDNVPRIISSANK